LGSLPPSAPPLSLCSSFFFSCYGAHRDLHSFPTRRSSDLLYLGVSRLLVRELAANPSRALSGVRRWLTYMTLFLAAATLVVDVIDRKSTRLNSSHVKISYAVFCLKKKKKKTCDSSHPQSST